MRVSILLRMRVPQVCTRKDKSSLTLALEPIINLGPEMGSLHRQKSRQRQRRGHDEIKFQEIGKKENSPPGDRRGGYRVMCL
jgi:hypothetical protein